MRPADPTSTFRRVAIGALMVLLVIAGATGCSEDGEGDDGQATASTVQADPESFLPEPRLPADVNPIPYLIGDQVALGNVSVRVVDVRDPDGSADSDDARRVAIDVELTNGALEPASFDPGSMRAYVDTGASATPTDPPGELGRPVASGETIAVTLEFDLPESAALLALVFDGTGYGDRVTSGLIALDPNFVPAPGDS